MAILLVSIGLQFFIHSATHLFYLLRRAQHYRASIEPVIRCVARQTVFSVVFYPPLDTVLSWKAWRSFRGTPSVFTLSCQKYSDRTTFFKSGFKEMNRHSFLHHLGDSIGTRRPIQHSITKEYREGEEMCLLNTNHYVSCRVVVLVTFQSFYFILKVF